MQIAHEHTAAPSRRFFSSQSEPFTMAAAVKNAFTTWKFRHFFVFVAERGNNITVQCNLCLPIVKMLSASKNSTSNLKKHLQRRHSSCLHLIKEENRQSESTEHIGEIQGVLHLPFKEEMLEVEQSTSQSTVSRLIFEFVIDDVQSFSLVEQPSFRNLIEGISGAQVLSRNSLFQHMEKEFAAMKEALTAKLQTVTNVCTTADLWTVHGRSFFGMTCHWIEEDSLERMSVALACARVKGHHTFDVLAAKICEIHAEYQVQHKVRAIVTNNGSNFVKPFREFDTPEEAALDEFDDGVTFFDMDAVLEMEGDEELHFFLPPHQRCAAHTLNLIATNEVHKAASRGSFQKVYQSAMGKCASIWNKAHWSSAAAEVVQDIASMSVSVPCVTRWSYEYLAIAKLIGLADDQLFDICGRLGVPGLNPHEITFLREYVAVLQPLAQSIDVLQGEKKWFLGFLIPTILSLKFKLSDKLPHVTYTANIITAVIEALDSQFSAILNSHDAKMATTTMPKFRLCWLPPEKREDMCKTVVQEATSLKSRSPAADVVISSETDGSDEEFFVFGKTNKAEKWTVEKEVRMFLYDTEKSLNSLHAYPLVKQLFLKYNTTIPSSAPVERLFSDGGNVLTSFHSRMSDHMEQVLLLRYNRKFCPKLSFDDL